MHISTICMLIRPYLFACHDINPYGTNGIEVMSCHVVLLRLMLASDCFPGKPSGSTAAGNDNLLHQVARAVGCQKIWQKTHCQSAPSSTNLQTCDGTREKIIPGPSSVSRVQLAHFSTPNVEMERNVLSF